MLTTDDKQTERPLSDANFPTAVFVGNRYLVLDNGHPVYLLCTWHHLLFCFVFSFVFFFHLFCFLFVFRITNMCPPPKECLKNTGKRRYDSSCCHYSFGYLFFSWVFEDGESSNDIIINKTFTLWSKTAKNTDWSTGPLACPFAHSLTPSLLGQWIIGWLFCLCFLLFSTIVKSRGRCQGFWFMEMGLWWYWQV